MCSHTVWADNADVVSVEYSGTGALKTDFTRTGKRTQLGVLSDGINSLIRYYKNNFADGFRQVPYQKSALCCVFEVKAACTNTQIVHNTTHQSVNCALLNDHRVWLLFLGRN